MDARCPHTKRALDERQAVYEAALESGIRVGPKRDELESARREYAFCLAHGWELEPQAPWQTWGEGWEKIYG